MKKIAFSVTNDLNFDQRMHRICKALSENGYLVTLIGRKRKNSLELNDQIYLQKRLKCIFNKGILFYAEYNLRLFFFFFFSDFDIYCAIDLDTILPSTIASKLKNKKLIYDAHEYFTEVPELENRQLVKKTWEKIAKWCIPHAHLCYTVSNSLANELSSRYHKSFSVIMNVPDGNFLKRNADKREKIIIYFGSVNLGRGLEELIESLQYLDYKLIIAGEGDLSDNIKILAEKFNVSDKIESVGMVSQEKMYALAEKAMIGYNLLDNRSKSYYYSLSNKFFYYIHFNLPGISNIFPEYLDVNNKFEVSLLTELTVEKIVFAVNKLTDDTEYYNRLKFNTQEAGNYFNWQNEKEKLLKMYFDL